MNHSFQRGLLLLQQGRHELAEREFRGVLAAEPDFAAGHAYLAACLAERGDKEGALREAGEAVRLDPSAPFHHYVMGVALLRAGRPREAEAAAEEAIKLDPHNADYFGLRASIAMNRGRHAEALAAADQGLAVDPQNTWCTNLRAMALVHLGRKDEAAHTLGSALRENPEDDFTHANQGWACLHSGDHRKALEHFREALRLDPENAWARAGLKESLKARFFFYRVVLTFSLWLARRAAWAQIAILLLIFLGPRLLASAGRTLPAFAPWLELLGLLLIGFILMSWVAEPLANFLLMFHPVGRLALTREERVQSVLVGSLFAAALGCLAARVATGQERYVILAMFFGLLIFPVQSAFTLDPPRLRLAMGAVVLVLIYLAAPVLLYSVTDAVPSDEESSRALNQWRLFVNAAIISSWLPFLLQARRLTR